MTTSSNSSPKSLPPFPYQQLFILALCRICEPIAFMSVFPYIYYMIQNFHMTPDASQISMYAGMVTSAFTLAEFSTGVIWGRLSDKVGRKPILITGLVGTGISMLIFGFAPNLTVALIARALGGGLNGNIGVLSSTVGELVTVREHQPRAYSVMPFVWCLGSIIGPALGGALAQPCLTWPTIFHADSLFDKFPYLLPNLVCTAVTVFGAITGILFLEETHSQFKHRRDPGLELGEWIVARLTGRSLQLSLDKDAIMSRSTDRLVLTSLDDSAASTSETSTLLNESRLGYSTNQDTSLCETDTTPSTPYESSDAVLDAKAAARRLKPSVTKAFNKPVVLIIIGYGILAYHTITFDSLLPVFLSTPPSSSPPSPPFHFIGGFGLSTQETGFIMTMQGIYSMISTLIFFPLAASYLGPLGLFRFLALSYPLLYLVAPYLILLPLRLRPVGIAVIVMWKCTYATFAFPSNAILLTNAAPSLLFGTVNGVAASTASLCRALGLTISGALYAVGLRIGMGGLVWWVTALMTVVGGVVALSMRESRGRFDDLADENDEEERLSDCSHEDQDAQDDEVLATSHASKGEIVQRAAVAKMECLLNDGTPVVQTRR